MSSSGQLIRIAIASDLHAFSAMPNGIESPSKLPVPIGYVSPTEHPMAGLVDLISKHSLQADFLLSPGDLTYQADPRGLAYAWERIQEIGRLLGARLAVSTVGNHDVASRGSSSVEAREQLLRLRPYFPFPERALSDQFWSRNYAIWNEPGVTVVLLNSCPLHTVGNKPEFERGQITEETLRAFKDDLQALPSGNARILVCHHHPHSHSELQLGEHDVMVRGQLLLNALEDHGDWLVIHGHKHHPKISYAAGGARSPVVFGAGSFSGNFGVAAETVTRNQFYVIELFTGNQAPGVRGRVNAWNWAYGRGWVRSVGSVTGLPGYTGFGCRRHPERLANQIAEAVREKKAKTWKDLCLHVSDLAFVLPSDYEIVRSILLSKHGLHVLEDGGLPAEIGVARA